jgi:hypothetical protein
LPQRHIASARRLHAGQCLEVLSLPTLLTKRRNVPRKPSEISSNTFAMRVNTRAVPGRAQANISG